MSHFVSSKSRKVSVSEWAKDAGGQHPPTFELWDKPVLTQSKDEYSCGDIAAMCLEACRARSLHHNKIVSPPRLLDPGFQTSRMFVAKAHRGLTWMPEAQMLLQHFTVKVTTSRRSLHIIEH